MELWIRSQSKQTLIKPEKLFTEDEEVYATTNSEFNERIGVYKTKERALEVLDEIERLLMPKMVIKNEGTEMYGLDGHIYRTNILSSAKTDIQELSTYVYKMPKD